MYTLIIVFIFIVCALLTLIVLVQNSKGGGLAAGFSGSNQYMGVRKTTDFLEKATWYLAGGLLFLCIFASAMIPRGENGQNQSIIKGNIENVQVPTTPNFPAADQGQKPAQQPQTNP